MAQNPIDQAVAQIQAKLAAVEQGAKILAAQPNQANNQVINVPANPGNGVLGDFGPAAKIINEAPVAGKIVNQSGYTTNNQIGSIPLYGEVDGYSEHISTTDGEAVRYFHVPWSSRLQFLQTMLGYSTNKGGSISRQLPDNHPDMPWLWAVDYELVKGIGAVGLGTSGLISYFNSDPGAQTLGVGGVAHIKLVYRPLDFELYSDGDLGNIQADVPEMYRFVTRDSDYAVQALPLPAAANLLKFSQNPPSGIALIGTPVNNGAGTKLFPTREVVYTWHDVPDVPDQIIDQCVGTVNDSTFDLPVPFNGANVGGYGSPNNGGYAPGTLLCMAPKKKRTRSVVGRVQWTITYRFLYRPTGWNYFPYVDPNSGVLSFLQATFNGQLNGPTLYGMSHFANLFTQPNPGILYVNNQG